MGAPNCTNIYSKMTYNF